LLDRLLPLLDRILPLLDRLLPLLDRPLPLLDRLLPLLDRLLPLLDRLLPLLDRLLPLHPVHATDYLAVFLIFINNSSLTSVVPWNRILVPLLKFLPSYCRKSRFITCDAAYTLKYKQHRKTTEISSLIVTVFKRLVYIGV
jgi:hypothetical protein